MTLFLNKNSASVDSKDLVILNLFSSLSSRWYPTNVIGSSVYSIFDSYADQFSSLSVDMSSLFMNYFLNSVKAGEYQTNTDSKMYQIFGNLYNLNKSFYQSSDIFLSSSVYNSYRNQIHLISDANFSSLSKEGIQRVGQSFSGISPLYSEQLKEYTGWRLFSTTASVVSEGINFVIIDQTIPYLGTTIPKNFTNITGSILYYSKTKLGVNTKVFSKKHYFSGLDSLVYGEGSVSVVYNQLQSSINSVVRADVKIYPQYSSVYSYYRPSLHSEEFAVTSSSNVFLTNDYLVNLYSGIYDVTGSVIELQDDCANYEWKYDWSVRTYNESDYDMYVRWYPSSSIPDSVYFTQIDNDESISYLPVTLDSPYSYEPYMVVTSSIYTVIPSLTFMVVKANKGSHYILNNKAVLEDTSGRMNNLLRDYDYGTDPLYRRARNQIYTTPIIDNTTIVYSGSTGEYQNFYESLYFEIWLNGIDKNFNNSYVQFKRQDSNVNLYNEKTIQDNGIGFCIDSNNFTFFSSVSSSIQYTSYSISDLRLEEPERWHYFAGTYLSGSVYLYVDGNLVQEKYNLSELPNVHTGYSSVVLSTSGKISCDEITLSNGFLSPDLALEHFNMSKPRLSSSMILASGSMYKFHQPMIRMKASGSSEIEWHQFSMRGDHRKSHYLTNRYYIEHEDSSGGGR